MSYRISIVSLICALFVSQASAISIELSGKVPDALQQNINALVAPFSPPQDCQPGERYLNDLQKEILRAVQALGYYQAEIQSLAPVSSEDCQNWTLALTVGEPIRLSSVSVTINGEGGQDTILGQFSRAFPLKPGDALHHGRYEDGKSDLRNAALLRGYFDFTVRDKNLRVDVANNQAQIRIVAVSGKRYRFGPLSGQMDERTHKLISDLRPYQTGDYYDATLLTRFNQRLRASGYFQRVLVRPLVQQASGDQVPMEIIYLTKPKDLYDLGGGFSTDTGPRVRVNWQRPRVNAAGHSMEAELFVSSPEQYVSFKYRKPLTDPANNFLSFHAGFRSRNDNDTVSDTSSVAVQRHWLSEESDWRRIAFLRYDLESFTQADEPSQTTGLLIPGMTISRIRRDNKMDPGWGDRQMLTLEVASDSLLSDIDLARVTAQTRWLRSFSEHRLLLRAEAGALYSNNFDKVPASLRYFTGGDQSVRGFAYQSLSPRDEDGELLGAKYMYSASAEYSYPVSDNWRAALFTDVGNASDEWFDHLARSVGAGIIWSSPVGPVRLYLARGENRDERTWRIHFAMGAAL